MFSLVFLLDWQPGTLHFILLTFTFLHLVIVFFLHHMPSCPHHRNLYCCSVHIMSSNPSLSFNPLLQTLSCSFMPLIHLTIPVCACWSATSFSFLTGQVSLPWNILLRTQLLYNLPLSQDTKSLHSTTSLNLRHIELFEQTLWMQLLQYAISDLRVDLDIRHSYIWRSKLTCCNALSNSGFSCCRRVTK